MEAWHASIRPTSSLTSAPFVGDRMDRIAANVSMTTTAVNGAPSSHLSRSEMKILNGRKSVAELVGEAGRWRAFCAAVGIAATLLPGGGSRSPESDAAASISHARAAWTSRKACERKYSICSSEPSERPSSQV